MQPFEFRTKLWEQSNTVRQELERLMRPLLRELDISPPQMMALFFISRGKGETVGSLTRAMGLLQGNVSTLCSRLEQLGLLRRERDSGDRRIVTLALTEKGQNVIGRLQQSCVYYDRQLAALPPEALDLILRGMTQTALLLKSLSPPPAWGETEPNS